MWSHRSNPVTGSLRLAVLGVVTFVAAVAAVAASAAGCGTGGDPAGAEAPARPGATAAASDPANSGRPSAGAAPSTGATGQSGPEQDDRSADAAVQVVANYFREINEASVAGRVADVAGTALSGCGRCAHDVANTRLFDQRGLHTDVGPYVVSDLVGSEPAGVAATVEFTVELTALRLLDPAGRETDRTAAGPSQHGSAELSFTADGWRIRDLAYSAG